VKLGDLKKGDRVLIRGEHAGTAPGEVLEVFTIDQLPAAGEYGAALRDHAEEILREWDVTEILWLQHRHGPHQLFFAALLTTSGETRDLQGQRLTIQRATIDQ
jgi:hypothetical protein